MFCAVAGLRDRRGQATHQHSDDHEPSKRDEPIGQEPGTHDYALPFGIAGDRLCNRVACLATAVQTYSGFRSGLHLRAI